MNKKVEFNPNMNRRDFLTGATAFVGSMLLAPNFAFAAQKKPKEIIVRAWGGAWGDALKAGVSGGGDVILIPEIPYTIEGDKPASVDLTIESRGCTDGGFCYMPQSWVANVDLEQPVADGGKIDLGGLAGGNAGEFPPPDEVFFPDVFPVDGNTVEIGIRIEPGFYVYKHRISAKSLSPGAQAGRLDLPKGKLKYDEFFGESEVYYDEVMGRLARENAKNAEARYAHALVLLAALSVAAVALVRRRWLLTDVVPEGTHQADTYAALVAQVSVARLTRAMPSSLEDCGSDFTGARPGLPTLNPAGSPLVIQRE